MIIGWNSNKKPVNTKKNKLKEMLNDICCPMIESKVGSIQKWEN